MIAIIRAQNVHCSAIFVEPQRAHTAVRTAEE